MTNAERALLLAMADALIGPPRVLAVPAWAERIRRAADAVRAEAGERQ